MIKVGDFVIDLGRSRDKETRIESEREVFEVVDVDQQRLTAQLRDANHELQGFKSFYSLVTVSSKTEIVIRKKWIAA